MSTAEQIATDAVAAQEILSAVYVATNRDGNASPYLDSAPFIFIIC